MHYENSFYCALIIEKGNEHVMKTFNNSLLQSLSYDVYLVDAILLYLNFQQIYSIGERQCYYMRLYV